MKTKDYWNTNLDTDNLSRSDGHAHGNLSEPLAFAATPEFEWLCKRAGDLNGRLLVDLGGGIGMQAILWAQAGARVVVVDMAARRLSALQEIAQKAGVADKIYCVAGTAESLPLLPESVDFVFTKSVLIHTNLPIAAKEIHRILNASGCGLFIEPLNQNPIIRLYRRFFAPSIWRSITRYFDAEALDDIRAPFKRLLWKPFYLVSAGSFFWQYGIKDLSRFRKSLNRWRKMDKWLLDRWPKLEYWCWFAAIEVHKSK